MEILGAIKSFHGLLTEWRRDLHAHPEIAFEETRTAALVAKRLRAFGLNVHEGVGRTGVVGSLTVGRSDRAIGLRADMDALPIEELNSFPHRSRINGKMHACGHDGHTAMLLGAAKYLSETRNFSGTVHFVFQPAEENEGGADAMIQDGLFERFPVEAIFGMHNLPGLPVGSFGLREGPIMAAYDQFEIVVTGKGAHAAIPNTGVDPIVVGASIVTALQTIVSRNVDPFERAIVSATQFHAGDTWNVIPETAVIGGTARSFSSDVQDLIEDRIAVLANKTAEAHGATAAVDYRRLYPATVNWPEQTRQAAEAAVAVAGGGNVDTDVTPMMGSEDFAFMLQRKPGCYLFIGNGVGEGGCMIHNPNYDFNDQILPLGASYWAKLVETLLKS